LTKAFSTLGDIAKGGNFLTWFLVLPQLHSTISN
jgi:hypothetical protein